MKKCILLIILVFLCFGCKAEYTIKINKDKSVEETVTALENEDYYARYPKSSKKRVIRFTATFVNDYLESLNYNRKIVIKNEYTGEQVQHKFKNLKEYFEKSKAHEQLYKTYDTNIDGKLVRQQQRTLLDGVPAPVALPDAPDLHAQLAGGARRLRHSQKHAHAVLRQCDGLGAARRPGGKAARGAAVPARDGPGLCFGAERHVQRRGAENDAAVGAEAHGLQTLVVVQ